MIMGLGIDITEVHRIRRVTDRFGDRFLQRIYTEKELAYCQTLNNTFRYTSLAARFAAKEAFYKAVFPLIRHPVSWKDCEVENDKNLVPHINVSDSIKNELNQPNIYLSLSHTDNYAAAVVLIEQ